MGTVLPSMDSKSADLRDVMPSCLRSILGRDNDLALPPAGKVVVLLVDGLGASALRARAGHAETLAPLLSAANTINAGSPTTTAAGLASLTTGGVSGQHGLVGFTVLDTNNCRVVNQLTGWDDKLDPATWQRLPTVFEQAATLGVPSFAVGPARFHDSGLTAAVLRGAEYRDAESIADRMVEVRAVLDSVDRALVYVYVPELDQAAHTLGWQSEAWSSELEAVDSAVRLFVTGIRPHEALLVTADHGVLDVPVECHLLFDAEPGLVDGIQFVAGDPRCLQLHFEPDATEQHRAVVLERWRKSERERAWVASRQEAISAGWFGPAVDAEVVPRIGDILVAARESVAYYDSRSATPKSLAMVGQHGSWTEDESEIPLLRFGAYAIA